jgi:hypothetical protein
LPPEAYTAPTKDKYFTGAVYVKLLSFSYENMAVRKIHSYVQQFLSGGMLLGAFAKLRKATVSFVMSVRPPALNTSALTERIFTKFDI